MNVWKFGTNYVDIKIMENMNIAYAHGDSMPTYLNKNRIRDIKENDIIVVASGKADAIEYIGVSLSSPYYFNQNKCKFDKFKNIEKSDDTKINNDLNEYSDVIYVKVKWLATKNIDIKGNYNYQGFTAIQNDTKNNIIEFVRSIELKTQNKQSMQKYIDLLKSKKNLILTGAPGTGKTYKTAEIAVGLIDQSFIYSNRKELMGRYQELVDAKQIAFTTFHQSMDYEEFVEGLKPNVENGQMIYEVKDGIFKKMCKLANAKSTNNFENAYNSFIREISYNNNEKFQLQTPTGKKFAVNLNSNNNLSLYTGNELNLNGVLTKENITKQLNGIVFFIGWEGYFKGVINHLKEKHQYKEVSKKENQPYILIIDEINRGNISKILGELITLLEKDKRLSEINKISVTLPYSNEQFSVPQNLYIIGTMNAADRSLGYIDYAIRRRFAFITLKANENNEIENFYTENNLPDESLKNKAIALFESVENLIKSKIFTEFNAEDLMIGHSYFMAENEAELQQKLEFEIIPLLQEYRTDGILNAEKEEVEKLNSNYKAKIEVGESTIEKEEQNENDSASEN